MTRAVYLFAVLLTPIVAVPGCSGESDGPATVRVAGTVYLDGKPIDGAEVRFINKDFAGYAVSGADGKFELVQGAMPGENTVTVTKFEGDFELDPEGGYDLSQLEFEREAAASQEGEMTRARSQLKGQLIPAEYSDPSKSKLKYTVPEDGIDAADLRLTTR
jgi:hypothetical protein